MKMRTAIIAGATALAMSLAVNAADWFSAGISSYSAWPATETTGAWGGTDGATLNKESSASFLEVDADDSAPLTFTAATKTIGGDDPNAEGATISTKVKFVAFAEASMPEASSAAKAGLIVVKATDGGALSYYGIKYVDGANTWVQLTGATPDTTKQVVVTVAIEPLTSGYAASYTVDNAALYDGEASQIPVNAASISGVSYSGSGEVAALGGEYDAIMYAFTVAAPDNASVTKVVCGTTELEAPYEVEKGSTVTVTYTANEGYVFPDGTASFTADYVIDADGKAIAKPEGKDAEEGKAKIGTTYYLTLNDALKAVKASEETTITVVDSHVNKAYESAIGSPAYKDLTIDLNGKTVSIKPGDKEQMRFFDGATVTIKNGTLERAGGTSDILRLYSSKMTLENVIFNATGCVANAIIWTNGSLDLKGTTAIENVEAGANAINCGNYAGTGYTMGTLTFDTTGTLAGDWVFAGGTIAVTQTPTFEAGTKFYYGAKAWTAYKDADVAALGFAARVGGAATATGDADVEPTIGELFFDLADAVTALASTEFDKKISLLADGSAEDVAEIATACTLDLNGKSFTVGKGATFAVNADLTVINSVAGQGGLVVIGTVYANAYVDLNDIAYGAGGLVKQQGGALTIGEAGSVKFMSAWDGETANALNAYTQGFFKNTANGAKVITGKTYTWNGSMFTIDGAIATATITRGDATFVEAYTSLADAIAAANVNTTVTLLANDTGTTAIPVNANLTVDINGFEVTIGGATINADKTLTLKNSKIGTSGWLKTTGAIAVNGTLDMSNFAMGVAYNGIHEDSANVEGGAIRIGEAGLVKFIADSGKYARGGKDCYSPNFMVANLPGTFGATATGAKIQLGTQGTWTYNGSLWAVENAVATAYLSGVARTSTAGEYGTTCDFTETYASLADAVAAADADSTIKLIADYSIDGLTLAKACTFDLNGKTLTIASGSSFTANANLKVVNSVADQGGLVVAGTVYANAYVNLNDIAYGAGGLVKQQGGALTIGAEGSVKFMSAWDGETANALNAYTQGFFKNTANGAKVITGTTYTWNGSMFTIDGAIATATITRGGATFVEAYTSLADAIAAANADTTVTLLADTTLASTLTISKAITLDLGGKNVGLPTTCHGFDVTANGATLKNGTLNSQKTADSNGPRAIHNAEVSANYEDLTINADHYDKVISLDSNDETLAEMYAEAPSATINFKNVKVHGNGVLIYAQHSILNLDANCEATATETAAFGYYKAAIYSACNATVNIAGGTYTHEKALLSGNLGAKIIANDGTFNGQIYSWMQVGAHSELEAYESYKATFTLNGGTYTDATIAFQNADSRSLDVFTKGVSVDLAAPTGYKWSNPQATSVETLVADNGPSVPAEEGKIEKKDDNTYVVTPAADTNVVTVSNLPDGAKVEVSAQIDLITGVPASQVVVTNTMVSGYDISAAFKVQSVDVVGGGVAAQIVLDETASVKIGEETIPVTPTVKDEVTVAGKTEPAFTPDGDNTAIAVKAIPGLTYQLIAGENVGTITTPASEATPATEAGIKLTADPTKFSSTTGKAFYKVQVTK